MDRNEYLKFCQSCSMYIESKKEIPSNLFVMYENIKYIPFKYEMSFNKGNVQNTAILKDLKANSVTYARLERVVNFVIE